MFFDPKLCVGQNGRFAKSWLAATNPKAFKTLTCNYEIQQIRVSTVCDEIRQMSGKHGTNRMSLYLTAQLVFGTVRIYQQQVLDLYENTKNLITCQQVLLQNIDFKRPPVPILALPPKKRKYGNIKSDYFDDVSIDDRVSEADSFATSNFNFDKYTMKQTILDPIEDDEDELFGEITGKEMDEFLSVLEGRSSMRDICCTPIPNLNVKKRSEIGTEVDGNVCEDESIESVQVARYAYPPNINNSRTSFDNVLSSIRHFEMDIPNNTKKSLRNNELQDENLQQSSNQVVYQTYSEIPLLTDLDISKQIDSQQLPQEIPNLLPLSKNTLQSLHQGKKRKPKRLQIDTIAMIPAKTILENVNSKCKSACDSILPYWKLHFKSSDTLFKSPCRRIRSTELLSNFTRHIKVKSIETDLSILSSVNDHHEILPTVQKRQLVGRRRRTATENFQFQQDAENPSYDFDDRTNNGFDLPEQLEQDLLECFAINPENMENLISHNRATQNKVRVLQKLWYLWKKKIFPIQMSLLCEHITRIEAANTFFSILELCNHRYVKLCRDENTTEICHVAMGDRLTNTCVNIN